MTRETELYAPVKRLLEKEGYTVQAEAQGCDIAAYKGDELLVAELKLRFNLKVVYQAMERRSLTDKVYIAVPRPKKIRSRDTQMMFKMLKELGLGLIVVGIDGAGIAETVVDPHKVKNINTRRRGRLLKEVQGRRLDVNVGGSTGRRIITAYTEASVLALCHMEKYDTLKMSQIKKLGYPDKVRNAFTTNAYGWFEKVGRGLYAMSEAGVRALELDENKELVDYYRNEVSKNV